MSMDAEKMIEMARERAGWRADGSSIANNGEFIAEACYRQDAPFIAHAPAFILAQAAHIATLEARLAALQARVEALGEWEKLSESPWLFKEETEFPVEMLVVVPALYIPDADDCKAHYEPNFFDDSGIEVLGWRALPLPPSE